MARKIVALGALVLVLAGCGSYNEANYHNAASPPKSTDVYPVWHRIGSPPYYPTIVTACVGRDGVYIDQDSANSVEVVPNDPNCR
jgi:hypothetical protein